MPRRLVVVLAALSLLLAAAVSAVVFVARGGGTDVTVSGAYRTQPQVTIPAKPPSGKLAIDTPIKGKGAQVHKGDLVIADYVGYTWSGKDNRLLASSYNSGRPGAFPSGALVPGLEKALDGKKVGTRVVAVVPPKEGYGTNGYSALQISGQDSLVYVLDVVGRYPKSASAQGAAQPQNDSGLPKVSAAAPGQAPKVTIPRGTPPDKLQVRTVIKGSGAPVESRQLVALQYTGMLWRDGKVFSSSWQTGQVFASAIGTGAVLKGWDQGLIGQRVGSRVMLVVPPDWGYGPKGLKQVGIKGTDTLVFAVDILGAH
jgi:FKBP-type peptidyl-prolyl cis-trans isomerase